jgi:WD40 repeat protein
MRFWTHRVKAYGLATGLLGVLIGSAFSDEPRTVAARPFPKVDRFGDPLPPGALFRLGTERFRHQYVSRLVYSPDGRILASITGPRYADRPEQQYATLWDAASGKKLHHLVAVGYLVFAPDGQTLAVRDRPNPLGRPPGMMRVGEMLIRVIEVKSGREIFGLPAEAQPPFAFSARGDLVTAGSGHVHVWSGSDGKKLTSFAWEGKELQTIAFSADSNEVVYVDKEFVLRAHHRESGRKLREVQLGPPGKVLRWDFYEPMPFITPDGRFYCDSGYDYLRLKDGVGRKNRLRIWEVATGKQVTDVPGVMRPLPGTGEVSGFALFDVALSRDNKTLAYAQSFGVITLVDVASGKARDLKRVDGPEDLGVAFSPDGKTLAAAGGHSHSIRFWDVATGREKADPSVHGASVYALSLSPDGQLLASGGRDYTIKLWDRKTGEYLHTFRGPQSDIVGLCFAPDGKHLASICHDGSLCFWNLATRSEDRDLRKTGGLPAQILSYSPGGELISSIFPKPVKEDDPRKKALEHMVAEGVLHVLEVATGKERLSRPLGVPAFFLTATASRGGRWLAVGAGKVLVLVELATGKDWKIDDPRATKVQRLAFSHDGDLLAVGDGARIHLFSTATRQYLRSIHEPGAGVTDLAFSPDGRYLAGTYLDAKMLKTTIRVWELASETPALEFASSLFSRTLLFTDGKTLFSAGEPSTVYAWGLEPPSWRAKAPPLLNGETLPQAWAALAAPKSTEAYEATWNLAAAGNQAVELIKKKLPPATRLPEKTFARLLRDLDSGQFKVRIAAMAELRQLGPRAETDLRLALAKSPSLEATQRIQTLLSELEEPMRSTESLRQIRAVAVLERIATPEARRLLQELARGLSEARLTREARQALRGPR